MAKQNLEKAKLILERAGAEVKKGQQQEKVAEALLAKLKKAKAEAKDVKQELADEAD